MRDEILFVIVTYREYYQNSVTYKSLVSSYENSKSLQKLNVFIGDNTELDNISFKSEKKHDVNINLHYERYDNLGLSYAYNKAMQYALEQKISWIVLLDQDTSLPLNFFDKYSDAVLLPQTSCEIKAPIIKFENINLSPALYKNYRSHFFMKVGLGKTVFKDLSCFNTGLMINAVFYKKVGGYNESLLVDFCDHDFLLKCKQYISYIEILDITLNQDFSTFTHSKEQALQRYKIYLKDMKSFSNGKNKFYIWLNSDMRRLVSLTLKYKSLDFLSFRLKK